MQNGVSVHQLENLVRPLDRARVTAALKRGEAVDGAKLVQSQPYITVSTR